jgi:hypothetical protein
MFHKQMYLKRQEGETMPTGNEKRDIKFVSYARHDLSPFLVHLSKNGDTRADQKLAKILTVDKQLKPGRFHGLSLDTVAYGTTKHPGPRRDSCYWPMKERDFRCVCMTETPLDQIHCLLDIKDRGEDLEPYGLVLLKERIQVLEDVCPVWYVNNYNGSRFIKKLVETMWRASFFQQPQDSQDDTRTGGDYDGVILRKALCFIENCGLRLSDPTSPDPIDFYWEREWRSLKAIDLNWTKEAAEEGQQKPNVFLGLCPHDKIPDFEDMSGGLPFIDPRRSPSYYAEKILTQKKNLQIFHNLL